MDTTFFIYLFVLSISLLELEYKCESYLLLKEKKKKEKKQKPIICLLCVSASLYFHIQILHSFSTTETRTCMSGLCTQYTFDSLHIEFHLGLIKKSLAWSLPLQAMFNGVTLHSSFSCH